MSEVRGKVQLFIFLAGVSCNVPSDPVETDAVEADVTSGSSYYLKLPKMSGDTGNCVAISGSSTADKAFAVEWDCNGGKNEQFVTEASGLGDGYYRLKNVNSGKCLNVYSGVIDATHAKSGNVDGAYIQQYGCNNNDNNLWKFTSYNGYYQIKSKLHNGDGKYRCMDIRGGNSATANGTAVELWTCGGTTTLKGNQTFNPSLISSGGGGTGGSGGSTGSGGSSGTGGSSGSDPCANSNLSWHSGKKTWFTSYPDPGSEECIQYSGCQWAGQFAYCGTKSESWVSSHNIAAFFPINNMARHNICIKSGSKTMVVTLVDTCGDNDCGGCCTQNKGSAEALIDLESYTNKRWGLADGNIQWADLGLNSSACN